MMDADMTVVDFSYRLVGTGWSDATLRIGDRVVQLTASYLGDALGDLLAAVVLLSDHGGDVHASWEEEPGEFRFVLSRDGALARVRVLWFDDAYSGLADERGQGLFDATCAFDDLLDAVAAGAREVLGEWGAAGYRERWVSHDFPIKELEALERARARRRRRA